jgi:hypothetical protein
MAGFATAAGLPRVAGGADLAGRVVVATAAVAGGFAGAVIAGGAMAATAVAHGAVSAGCAITSDPGTHCAGAAAAIGALRGSFAGRSHAVASTPMTIPDANTAATRPFRHHGAAPAVAGPNVRLASAASRGHAARSDAASRALMGANHLARRALSGASRFPIVANRTPTHVLAGASRAVTARKRVANTIHIATTAGHR